MNNFVTLCVFSGRSIQAKKNHKESERQTKQKKRKASRNHKENGEKKKETLKNYSNKINWTKLKASRVREKGRCKIKPAILADNKISHKSGEIQQNNTTNGGEMRETLRNNKRRLQTINKRGKEREEEHDCR